MGGPASERLLSLDLSAFVRSSKFTQLLPPRACSMACMKALPNTLRKKMPRIGRVVSLILLLPAFVLLSPDESFLPGAANAQGLIRNLTARLRGETMPQGIVKANGLIETAQADVSSKYPGRITEISVKEGAQVTIGQALARVSSPEADVTLVSPRDGEVQDVTAEAGDTVAAGEPIATIIDLTDLNLTVFLPAADAGKLAIGDGARVILDAAPDYVIPAVVSFVASDRQVSPKAVETKDERAKQMFRVNLRVDPQVVKTLGGKVETGLLGAGFVRTKPDVIWPPELQIKLPPAPVAQEVSPAPALEQQPAAPAASPIAQQPAPTPAPTAAPEALAPSSVAQDSAPASTAAPAVGAPKPGSAPAQAPVTVAAAPPPTPAPVRQEPPGSAPPVKAPTPASGAVAESTTSSAPVEQDVMAEFAPQSVKQLAGAWAPPGADCNKIFQRKGRAITYRQPADLFMKAVIVDPQRIRLPSETCELDSAIRDGGSLKLIAECANVISYTSRTVYVKLRSNGELVYSPTGDPVLATNLMRCPI
jgi:biotin carboxyl carrier protein